MTEQRVKKLLHSLFFRVYLYFAIILAIFAIVLGVIFGSLYSKSVSNSQKQQLEGKAKQLANNISTYVIGNDISNYISYLISWQEILLIENTDIWIVQNPENPMNSSFANVLIDNVTLTADMEKVLNRAFQNEFHIISSFDEIYGKRMMRAAAPIHDSGGNVVGAVLLNTFIESQDEIISSSQYLIIISALLAFLIAFIISSVFAKQLSNPITKMRRTALKLAEGDYKQKTGIKRRDEIGQLASTIDILSERLAENEEAHKEMEQMRMDFFSNVSHELRTPITVMRGYTETLNDGMVTKPEKIQQYYGRMLNECKSMERLVGDLLILSKMQNPDFVIEMEPINLVQVFEDILRSTSVIAAKKEIKLCFNRSSDTIMMLGDYDRLRQMFIIIIDNAIKFSHENSSIYIEIKDTSPLQITIEDEGIGIAKEELPYIFEKFYKSKLRQNATGSGLGLVIAKQIAIRHKGTISVESVLGKGTKFTFNFDRPTQKLLESVE